MKYRPILFSAPMVLAILEGRKTKTRRIMKPQPSEEWQPFNYCTIQKFIGDGVLAEPKDSAPWGYCNEYGDEGYPCPFGTVGDRLWVRETFFCATGEPGPTLCHYRADNDCDEFKGLWRPSIFMPRWASRITLEIVSVKVERLQDISEADELAEGATPEMPFGTVWRKINTKPDIRWEDNPWVWAIEFKKV